MRRGTVSGTCAVVLLAGPILLRAGDEEHASSSATPKVESFALTDAKDLVPEKVAVEAVQYRGRKAVLLTRAEEGKGVAFVRGVDFADGTIEADVAVRVTTPPGERNPGFIGIAFRSRQDALHYEMFYVRPGNARSDDQAMRNHAVQYIASPEFDWYKLRRTWPAVYESYVDLEPETWTRIKIEVEGRRAKLYVNGSTNPVLVVNGLKGEDLKGAIGLWGSTGQESYFSNLRITHATRQPIENGGEAAGTWEFKYSSDVGTFPCQMKLERDGTNLSGTISGLLGQDVPVTGTWRNGYVELTFHGNWERPKPGEATANLAGWIDGDSAKGRMVVNGRTDGTWSGMRKQ